MEDNKKAPTNESGKYNYIGILSNEFENSKQFVCFNDKKVPLSTNSLFRVDITNTELLGTLNEALECLSANKNIVVGIGIVLGHTKNGNLCVIDIDYCIDDNGNISKEAKEIINYMNSYTEISRSGKGIHIIFYATKKGDSCKINNLKWCEHLEMYDKNRYIL